jgi:hypothetical protein
LFNGLLSVSVVAVVLSRFVLKNALMEFAAWAAFGFLEVYPKMYFGSTSSFYEGHWWKMGVQVRI